MRHTPDNGDVGSNRADLEVGLPFAGLLPRSRLERSRCAADASRAMKPARVRTRKNAEDEFSVCYDQQAMRAKRRIRSSIREPEFPPEVTRFKRLPIQFP